MRRHATLDQIASEIMSAVDHAQQTKTAAAVEPLRTEVGQMMSKLAQELRASNPSDVTYEDIAALWSADAR